VSGVCIPHGDYDTCGGNAAFIRAYDIHAVQFFPFGVDL
jgi:hypothetical protein